MYLNSSLSSNMSMLQNQNVSPIVKVTEKFSSKFFIVKLPKNKMSTNCLFCKIVSATIPSEIYYEDNEIMIFKDIKPASKYHLLAIPKLHKENVNSLTSEDIPLIERLVREGLKILTEKGESENDVRLGFHCPPFNSVAHLHLHLIAPASQMSLKNKLVFMSDSWWFCSVDKMLENLRNKL